MSALHRLRLLLIALPLCAIVGSGAAPGAAADHPAPPRTEAATGGEVAALVGRFMRERLAERPVEPLLSSAALGAYLGHARDLWLYDDTLPGGPGAIYRRFSVRPARPLAAPAGNWRVEVRIGATWEGDAPPGELVEILRVGPGSSASGGAAPLLVLAGARRPSTGGLPAAVARTRWRIHRAAVLDDDRTLRALTSHPGFTYSFGERGDPVSYWRRLEDAEVPVLGDILGTVMHSRFARQGDVYVWPSAHARKPSAWTAADLAALRRIASPEEIRRYRRAGAYLGWRVGIRRDGTWLFFVSGD